MSNKSKSYHSHKLINLLVILLLVGVTFFERQNIFDFYRLHSFQPTSTIVELTTDDQMTSLAQKYFYVMHAQLDDKTSFNIHCSDFEKTIVLGCHISHRGIYILDVTDSRLAGVEQVTAAHEMLHEAYERLSPKERTRIDGLTNQVYLSLNNNDLKQKIALYSKQGTAIIPSELHSILGTEYGNLPPDLENYYSRYFKNRQSVLAFAQKYNDVFEQRRNSVNQFDAQLLALNNQIDSLKSSIQDQSANLNTQRSSLNKLAAGRQTAAYNAAVPVFNNLVAIYNNDVNRLRDLVDQYNNIVKDRNAIAVEERQLIEAIDSHTQSPATQ